MDMVCPPRELFMPMTRRLKIISMRVFISHHFTEAEITHCCSQSSPPSSFAARWVGKEAVFKSLSVKSKGVTAAMKDIEIVNDESSVPTVHLHGEAKAGATGKFEHFALFTDLKSFFFVSLFFFVYAYLCLLVLLGYTCGI